MYSFTVTGINNILPIQPHEPQLRIRCACQRTLIQQQIFTCLSCFKYCCHYCTIPDIHFYQCRNCKGQYQPSSKVNKCKYCFACPYCFNVLTCTKTQNKKYMMWCQHCYWTTKQLNISSQKKQQLIQTLNKLNSNLKGTEQKIYNLSLNLFKEIYKFNQEENLLFKISTGSIKQVKKIPDKSFKDVITHSEKNSEHVIKKVGINENSQQFDYQQQYPQNLPLLAKKLRKCPHCKKPLTNLYRTQKPVDQKVQLIYKQLKIFQCQIKPAINGKVKLKCLKDLVIKQQHTGNNPIQCKINQIVEVHVNQIFIINTQIYNKGKAVSKNTEYEVIVLAD